MMEKSVRPIFFLSGNRIFLYNNHTRVLEFSFVGFFFIAKKNGIESISFGLNKTEMVAS